MDIVTEVTRAMIAYYTGDVRRINHFLKVHAFATTIGKMEALDEKSLQVLEIAALTHDIGIKISEKKYGNTSGEYQQLVGPPEAEKMLKDLGVNHAIINEVCWLIEHHHTYDNIQGSAYRILVEADFLVNAYEDKLSIDAIQTIKHKLFRTNAGLEIIGMLFPDP